MGDGPSHPGSDTRGAELGRTEAAALAELARYMARRFSLPPMAFYPAGYTDVAQKAKEGVDARPASAGQSIWKWILNRQVGSAPRFCHLLRRSREGLRRCQGCDLEEMHRVKQADGVSHYECHAGLTDMSAPVRRESDGEFLGAIFTGQSLLEPPSESHFREVWKRIRDVPALDRKEMKAAYGQLPVMSQERLRESKQFLQLFASTFGALESRLSDYMAKERSLQQAMSLARRALAERLLFDPTFRHEEFTESAAALGMRSVPSRVLVMEVAPGSSIDAILDALEARFPPDGGMLFRLADNKRIAALVPSSQARSEGSARRNLDETWKRIRAAAEAAGELRRMAWGVAAPEIGELGESYRSALRVMQELSPQRGRPLLGDALPEPQPTATALIGDLARLFRASRFAECETHLLRTLVLAETDSHLATVDCPMFLALVAGAMASAARDLGASDSAIEGHCAVFLAQAGGAKCIGQCRKAAVFLLRHLAGETLSDSCDWNTARIRRALDYVRQNLGRKVSLEEAARQVRLSPVHFAREFKKVVGRPYSDVVLQSRIERAKEWLDERKLTVGAIGSALGFSSDSAFVRAFRRTTGVTPGGYRSRRRA